MKNEVDAILMALNSCGDFRFKYPIGNKELTIKVRELESAGIIAYDVHNSRWIKRPKGVR